MKISVVTAAEIGRITKLVRKKQGLRQDDLAGVIGVSHVYMGDVEKGKETVSLGGVLKIFDELGVRITLDIPDELNLDPEDFRQ